MDHVESTPDGGLRIGTLARMSEAKLPTNDDTMIEAHKLLHQITWPTPCPAERDTQTAVRPPSTASLTPWMKLARSVAKKTMASAISSGVAGRPAGA